MSAEKRSTNEPSSQIIKRQRSDANMGSSSALTVASGTGRNGALIQSVGVHFYLNAIVMELKVDWKGLDG